MRVPIGFVVEGVCEYQSFESIIRKGISAAHGRLPLANAWGNGGLRKRLEEHLVEVIKVNHPVVIIAALDMRDALAEGNYTGCAELRMELQERADRFLRNTKGSATLHPLPLRAVIIVQTPAFESWLTADPLGLQSVLSKKPNVAGIRNVDEEIQNHRLWLAKHVSGGYSKSPAQVHRLVKNLHPARMARHSRSFAKFWKEVVGAYQDWSQLSGMPFEMTLD